MKKILFSMAVVALIGAMTSCNSSKNYTPEEKALGDSAAMVLGKFAGIQENTKFQRMKLQLDSASFAKLNKKSFLRGLKAALEADTTDLAYFQGFQLGSQLLLQPVMGIEREAKVPVSTKQLYESFKTYFLADSTPDAMLAYGEYQTLMARISELVQQREREAKANTPEAKTNAEAGQAYVEKVLASEGGYQKTDDGLVYLITNPGEGDQPKNGDRILVKYVGKKIDGTVFDQSGDEPATFFVNSVVPGFAEGLKMLGKGGTAQLVIPADLAYGVEGSGSVIGPNETLIFDVELVDINPVKE